MPPIDILDKTVDVEFSEADNTRRAEVIEEALASYGVDAKMVQTNVGPTVTQFGVEPGPFCIANDSHGSVSMAFQWSPGRSWNARW